MKSIQQTLSKNLIALYTAKPKFFYETDIIVVKEKPFASLQTIKKQVAKTPYILLSQNEVLHSTDVFPLQFSAIMQTKTLIEGEDIFKKISIKKSDVRRKLEYDFRNKNIYLRQEALSLPAKKLLEHILPELFPAFVGLAFLHDVSFEKNNSYQYFLKTIAKKSKISLDEFFPLCDEKISHCTKEEAFDTLQNISIALENLADHVNTFTV